MDAAEILNKAAEVIETRGWHQGGYMPYGDDTSTCPVCVLAAINIAAGHHPETDFEIGHPTGDPARQAAEEFADHLGIGEQLQYYSVTEVIGEQWNDHDASSAEQVIAELRATAAEIGQPS